MHTTVETIHMGTAGPKRPKNLARFITCAAIAAIASGLAQPVVGAPVVRQGAGANAASLQAIVDLFRNDLGGPSNGQSPTQMAGRRELNWDGVPDNFAEPNNFPVTFFNVNSPRGIVFNAIESETGSALNQFAVSANAASGVPVRFGNLNSSYTAAFQTFSSQRLFIARNTPIMEVVFFVPGTKIPATVHGFGVVFTDVDSATGGNRTVVRCYGIDGSQLTAFSAPVHDGGLSFAGVSFNAGERIARVVIESGNAGLSSSNNDEVDGNDIVAMDDFIYGEPQPIEYTVAPAGGEPFVVTITVPLKFLSMTATGAPAGFVNATLRCAPHHTYRVLSSTDQVSWHPATISGAPAGPDQNLFNPRNPALWNAGTHAAPLSLSREGQNKLFYMVTDEVTGEMAFGETPDATPTPTATPTATPGSTATPQPTATATPTGTATPPPTPEPSATASPGASPLPGPFKLLNIATRLRVQTGENVLIGGIIVTGTQPKKVIIRAVGPSLSPVFNGALSDPTLELFQGDTLLAANDNWKDSQQAEIEATTIPPSNDLESAIVRTLAPGFYTAVMSGQSQTTGVGVIEFYDLDQSADSKLANIATRGFVEGGDSVMIGGLIVGGNATQDARILLRAIGPSLGQVGVADALQDPTLELRDANGEVLRENNNWQENQQAEIEATTISPSDPAESAIVVTLPPGNYTAVVRGAGDTVGVGLVEVYNLE